MRKSQAAMMAVLTLVLLLTSTPTAHAQAGRVFFSNNPISIFGDPEISKVYMSYGGVFFPTWGAPRIVRAELNLSIPNPSRVEFFINGSPARTSYQGGRYYALSGPFQAGQPCTFSVRVEYATHQNSYTCGTWSLVWEAVVSVP
jgi:hypothetical protein